MIRSATVQAKRTPLQAIPFRDMMTTPSPKRRCSSATFVLQFAALIAVALPNGNEAAGKLSLRSLKLIASWACWKGDKIAVIQCKRRLFVQPIACSKAHRDTAWQSFIQAWHAPMAMACLCMAHKVSAVSLISQISLLESWCGSV